MHTLSKNSLIRPNTQLTSPALSSNPKYPTIQPFILSPIPKHHKPLPFFKLQRKHVSCIVFCSAHDQILRTQDLIMGTPVYHHYHLDSCFKLLPNGLIYTCFIITLRIFHIFFSLFSTSSTQKPANSDSYHRL